jgi:regulatory protein
MKKKITDIEDQKRNPNRKNIYINNEYICSASIYVIAKNKIQIDMEIDEVWLKKICSQDNIEKAKDYCLKYMIHKPVKRVEDKLKEKGYEEEVIAVVIAFLKEYKFVDDEDYARRYISDGINQKKQGMRRIEQALKQKGVKTQQTLISDENELNNIRYWINRTQAKYEAKAPTKREAQGKMVQFLMRKGFSYTHIKQVLNEKTP